MSAFIQSGGTGEADGSETPRHYAQADLDKARQVITWLREHDLSRSWLAKKMRTSSSTISQVLNLKYPSPPSELLDGMLAVLQVETDRLGDGTPGYVAGSLHRLAFVVCDRTRKHRNFGVLVGNVGVGKTRTLEEVKARRPQTLLIEANPRMTSNSILVEILGQLHSPKPLGLDAKFAAIVSALLGTNYLLIVDEAETLTPSAMHYVRRIRDKAKVGVVLAGTTKLHEILKPEQGQFEQIRSRVSMWPRTVKSITRDDMDELVRDALRDAVDNKGATILASDEVLDAMWSYCGGSARVLMESLMPALRDFVLGRMELTPKAVDAVATDVLFLERRRA